MMQEFNHAEPVHAEATQAHAPQAEAAQVQTAHDHAEAPRPQPPVATPAGPGLLSRFIIGNYFYFLSAALMLWGCYLMMPDKDVATANLFGITFKALAALQGYEALVIATALVIVWRFKALDDAFSLLVVELLLLLDPTFFSNSFFTMMRGEQAMLNTLGVLVNVGCFALVPLKLALLERGLKLRFAPGAWAAFLFAAFFAYLAEGPLCRREGLPGLGRMGWHYLMAWGPVGLALLAPKGPAVEARGAAADHLTDGRRRGLGVLWVALPLAVIVAHLYESTRVHELELFIYPFAPLALAAAVLIVRLGTPEAFGGETVMLLACDLCAAAALLLGSGVLEYDDTMAKVPVAGYALRLLPPFAKAHVPLLLTGLGVAGMYGLFYHRFRSRAALYRIWVLAAGGVIVALAGSTAVRAGVAGAWHGAAGLAHQAGSGIGHSVAWTLNLVGKIFTGLCSGVGIAAGYLLHHLLEIAQVVLGWLGRHPGVIVGAVWLGLLAVAVRWRNAATWFVAGVLTIWIAAGWLPGEREELIPEMLQAVFILGLALDHRFNRNPSRPSRYCTAVIVVAIALLRFMSGPAVWKGCVIAAEGGALIGAAILLRHPGYAVIGAAELAGLGWLNIRFFMPLVEMVERSPGAAVIVTALALFGAGIAVTFNKERLLKRIGSMEAAWAGANGPEAAGTKWVTGWPDEQLATLLQVKPRPKSDVPEQAAPKPEEEEARPQTEQHATNSEHPTADGANPED